MLAINLYPGKIVTWCNYKYTVRMFSKFFAGIFILINTTEGLKEIASEVVPISELKEWDGTTTVREQKRV